MYLAKELINSGRRLVDLLFEEVSDYDIYCELIGEDINIGVPIRSPIREHDTRASFSIFFPTRKLNARPEELW